MPPNPQILQHYHFDVDRRKLAFLVGILTFALPTILILASFTPLVEWRDSISHYYYVAFLGDIFILILAFVGTFMVIYEGRNKLETRLATTAGFSAFGIAIFPTSFAGLETLNGGTALGRIFIPLKNASDIPSPGNLMINTPTTMINEIPASFPASLLVETTCAVGSAFCLFPYVDWLHYGSAVFMFGFLTWYCLKVFPTVDPARHTDGERLTTAKLVRNTIYYLCGGVMFASIGLSALKFLIGSDWTWWNDWNMTFRIEAAALYAFALGWMVRSRFMGKIQFLIDPIEIEQMKAKET